MVCKHLHNQSSDEVCNQPHHGERSNSSLDENKLVSETEMSNPNEEDWKHILSITSISKYRKGDYLQKEGSSHAVPILYILNRGSCVEEKMIEGTPSKFLHYQENETMGEPLFLLGGKAVSSIIAESDQVEALTISGAKLQKVFQNNPTSGSRFFKFLADVLSHRLRILQQQVIN